eukprot:GFYU01009762.1.p1 GENE.GFYU01009762.1~~GFYU01009762.1.p1  ORF type:complete len:366 (+),score=98.71 GFYU01009762.1:179-1276(+)
MFANSVRAFGRQVCGALSATPSTSASLSAKPNAFLGSTFIVIRNFNANAEHVEADMSNLKIGVVGTGKMAGAVIEGMLGKNLIPAANITCSAPRAERRCELELMYPGVATSSNNLDAIKGKDLVILGVKPQVLPIITKQLRGQFDPSTVCMSVMAGVRMADYKNSLGVRNIVRTMPNTPCTIGEGITMWATTDEVSDERKRQVQSILRCLGEELYVQDEKYIDMSTAVSGSGPAYVFLMMEAMVDAGVHMGFPRWMAQKLVMQTLQGSVAYAKASGRHAADLRNDITSPGGTTSAALYALERGGMRTVLADGIWASYKQSLELGAATQQQCTPLVDMNETELEPGLEPMDATYAPGGERYVAKSA